MTLYKATIFTGSGPRTATIMTSDPFGFELGLCVYLQPDDFGNHDALLAVARTLGLANECVQLGPVSVFSPDSADGVALVKGMNAVVPRSRLRPTDEVQQTAAIGTLVTLDTMGGATALLPFPYSFAGSDAVYDPATGNAINLND